MTMFVICIYSERCGVMVCMAAAYLGGIQLHC
jgi:hypothetical protein